MRAARTVIAAAASWLGAAACTGVIDTPAGVGEATAAGRAEAGSADAGGALAGSGGRTGGSLQARAGAAGDDAVAGSAGSGSGSARPDAGVLRPPPPRSHCDAVREVFEVSCGNGSCHSNRGARIGDFAVGPEQAAAMVGRGSVRNAGCGLIIDPSSPEDSLILTKLTGRYRTTSTAARRCRSARSR